MLDIGWGTFGISNDIHETDACLLVCQFETKSEALEFWREWWKFWGPDFL